MNEPDGEAWKAKITNENKRMKNNEVFEVIDKDDLPSGTKLIDSTWACKQKNNGVLRRRLNVHVFEQNEEEHYDPISMHAPVTNTVTIRVVFTPRLMAGWTANAINVKGELLHGFFKDNKKIHMKVSEGCEHLYPNNAVLLLLKMMNKLK